MPDLESNKQLPPRLSDQIETHRKEAQSLLTQGGEQPQYEFKRLAVLTRDNLDERLDFVKFVQAVANAELKTDRCIVIGGDPKEKKFFPVTNLEEFDQANLSKILGSYLDPSPLFQSYRLTTDYGIPFVLIVVEQNQPRPIIVKKQGHTEKGKTRLEEGDIWIKKNTDTLRANRADIDLMYKLRTEEEAETKARKRLAHFLELDASVRFSHPGKTTSSLPTFGMLVGSRNDFRTFVGELIGTNDQLRFKMLLELCRETIVEGWESADVPRTMGDFEKFFAELDDRHANQYLPALDSLIHAGLLLIKYEADPRWLEDVANLLVESFDACRRLARFEVYQGNKQENFPSYWWRPSLELYIGFRAIACYAVLRKRHSFLKVLLPHIVARVTVNRMYSQVRTPIMFWPFAALPFVAGELAEGRAQYFWSERVAASWGTYFGTLTRFVESSSQLELLLEFNSYLGTNQIHNPQLQDWVKSKNETGITFEYVPDLFAQDLQSTVPMAETLYDILASGGLFPDFLSVDPRLPLVAFGSLNGAQRLELYGGFLHNLKAWQSQYRSQAFHAFGFMWNWEGRLKAIAQVYAEREKTKQH